MKFTLFRTPKPKGYRYRPRFYDPKKEEMQKRQEAMERGVDDEDAIRYRLTAGFKRGYDPDVRKMRKAQIRKSNMILVGAVFFLLIIGYILAELNIFDF